MFCNLSPFFSLGLPGSNAPCFYDLFLLATRVMALMVGVLHLKALHTVMLFALVEAVMNLFLILLVGHAFMKEERDTIFQSICNHKRGNVGDRYATDKKAF